MTGTWAWVSRIAAVSSVAFVVGSGTTVFYLPPASYLVDAIIAFHDFLKIPEQGKSPLVIIPASTSLAPRPPSPERMAPGLTFISAFRDGAVQGFLVDAAGREVHRWRVLYSDVWPQAPHLSYQATDDNVLWHGVHVFDNGDLLFNFEGGHFPFGGGLVRIDKDSRILWTLPLNTHHTVAPDPDGTFWVGSHRWLERPGHPLVGHAHYEDELLQVDGKGRVIRTINLLDALLGSQLRGLLDTEVALLPPWETRLPGDDPLHLNSVSVVSAEEARAFPPAKAGDLLVSFRNVNAVCILDRTSAVITWCLSGPFVHQHSPRLTPRGTIILFDNVGANPSLTSSRVIEIDPFTQKVLWTFEEDLRSPIQGKVRLLPNGNVLVAETRRGRALEIARDGTVVWEFVNALDREIDGQPAVGAVTDAIRVPPEALGFLGKDDQ